LPLTGSELAAGWCSLRLLLARTPGVPLPMDRSFSLDIVSEGGVVLKLEDACIETTARRARREIIAVLLGGRASEAAEEAAAETLAAFLTTTNFAALRAQHPELARGNPCRVRLHRDVEGVQWEIVRMQ
jgi:hypothetical protein